MKPFVVGLICVVATIAGGFFAWAKREEIAEAVRAIGARGRGLS